MIMFLFTYFSYSMDRDDHEDKKECAHVDVQT